MSKFLEVRRQQFRKYFQPSRIVLGVLPASTDSGVNVITLCFDMYCSYKPPMMAVAIQQGSASYDLIKHAPEWVLSVPGPSLVRETMFCGVTSLREMDKVQKLSLELCKSVRVGVPGLRKAIANIELRKSQCVETGDHIVAIGKVMRFSVNEDLHELPLLSIGPNLAGYKVLAKHGIHRIGVVKTPSG